MAAPIGCGGSVFGPCFCYSVLCVLHLNGEERAGCFTLTVILMYCDSQCSVALSLVGSV